jgi:GNAT superfamily N-acetyltransferase
MLGYPTQADGLERRIAVLVAKLDHRVVVAEVDGQIRGVAGLRRDLQLEADGPYVCLTVLVVDEAARGLGVGTALVEEAERWAATLGATRLMLTSGHHRTAAHRFYERLGFASTGVRFVKTPMPCAADAATE